LESIHIPHKKEEYCTDSSESPDKFHHFKLMG
jgi:hypothetical protein